MLPVFCGSSCFGCRRCKRTRGQDFYREQFYENLRQVNNGTEVIEMTSRQQMTSTENNRCLFYKGHYYSNKLRINNENSQDTNNRTNQQYETPQFEDNGTNQQYETPIYDDQIEEMVQFPNGTEAVYAVIGGGDIYSHTNEVNRT